MSEPKISPRDPARSHNHIKSLQKLNSQYVKSLKTMEIPNLNDDSMVDLEFEKNLTKIDYEKMEQVVKQRHATKDGEQYYNCKDVCYNFNTGKHYCLSSSEKTELSKFGVGITLYFKFVKHLIIFFTLFTLLSIPAYVFYISGFANYKSGSSSSLSYLDLLTATTVGAVGLGNFSFNQLFTRGIGASSCGVSKYPGQASSTDEKRMVFQCPTGTIASIDNIVYGLVSRGSSCTLMDEDDLTLSCNNYNTSALQTAFSDCVGASSCTFNLTDAIFTSTDNVCNELYKSYNIYMKVTCESTTITIGNNDISKTTIAFVVAFFDAAIILVFLVMIHTLKYAQKSSIENIHRKAYSASSYTVEITNLPQDMPAEELSAKLWTFLEDKLGESAVKEGHRVIDVQVVLPNKLIEYSKDYGEVIHTKNTLIRQWMQLYAPEYPENEVKFSDLKPLLEELQSKDLHKGKEAVKLYKKIQALVVRKEKILNAIHALKTKKDVRIVCAFVTLSSVVAKKKILEAFASSPFDRFSRNIFPCLYEKEEAFHQKLLLASSAPDPGSILWENLGEKKSSIILRRATSATLTLLLWVISGIILLVSTYFKNYISSNYPTVDCTNRNPTLDETGSDFGLGDYQVGLVQCYCEEDVFGRLNDVFTTAGNQTLCYTWFTRKVVDEIVTIVIVVVVLIINYSVQFVFQGLSNFEKHATLNQQLVTRVIKTFVAQFLNTGVIILIVNARSNFSFWQGKYRDLSPLWFSNVGSTLLSTMFINVFTVPTVKAAAVLYKKILQLVDRGCKKDKRLTKKKTQTDYENLYTGPEFIIDFRYSQILTLMFVCFLYSGGMPLLYLTSLAQLVLTYYFDKFFLLRVSQLPKNYDEKLEKMVRPSLYIILIFHFIFTIFMFGNSDIFDQSVQTFSSATESATRIVSKISKNSEDNISKFFTRANLSFNKVLSIVLIILLALYLIKGVMYGLLKKTVFALFSKGEAQEKKKTRWGIFSKIAPENTLKHTFFHVIKTEDIATLIRLTKITIKDTENEELIKRLKMKLELLKQEYAIKKKEEEDTKKESGITFIGFYTYDVRLHPTYKAQFAIEELLDDEKLD